MDNGVQESCGMDERIGSDYLYCSKKPTILLFSKSKHFFSYQYLMKHGMRLFLSASSSFELTTLLSERAQCDSINRGGILVTFNTMTIINLYWHTLSLFELCNPEVASSTSISSRGT